VISLMLIADLHIHSVYSDGKASPREIIRHALIRGINVISITDHDTFKGGLEGYRFSREIARNTSDTKILVVPGIELRSYSGDILVYCENDVELPREVGLLIDKAHENNCVVVPAHPFDTWRHGLGDVVYDYDGWDAIEVWNAHASRNANRRALEASRIMGKPGVANSDAHIPEHVGSAYTYILIEDASSITEVLDALRKGLVKPHQGGLSLKDNVERIAWSIEYRVRKILGD